MPVDEIKMKLKFEVIRKKLVALVSDMKAAEEFQLLYETQCAIQELLTEIQTFISESVHEGRVVFAAEANQGVSDIDEAAEIKEELSVSPIKDLEQPEVAVKIEPGATLHAPGGVKQSEERIIIVASTAQNRSGPDFPVFRNQVTNDQEIDLEEKESKCIMSDHAAPTEQNLQEPTKSKHLTVGVKDLSTCPICGKQFKQSHNLKEHIKTHNPRKTFQCSHCSHQTHRLQLLKIHIQNQHSNKKPFECKFCGALLMYRQSYKEHMSRHLKKPSKECDICHKKFYSPSALTIHKKTHKSASLKCDLCDKMFRLQSGLKRHMKLHNVACEYYCAYCSYSCKDRSNLRKHEKMRHNVVRSSAKRVTPLYDADGVQTAESSKTSL